MAKEAPEIYRDASRLSFLGVRRLAVVTDASTHNNQDFLMSLALDPETQVGAHMASMCVRSSEMLYPGEFNLAPESEYLQKTVYTSLQNAFKRKLLVPPAANRTCRDAFHAPG